MIQITDADDDCLHHAQTRIFSWCGKVINDPDNDSSINYSYRKLNKKDVYFICNVALISELAEEGSEFEAHTKYIYFGIEVWSLCISVTKLL